MYADICIYRRLGGESNREIVSFRSSVRCEAVCARETMLFSTLGRGSSESAPPVRARACPPPLAWAMSSKLDEKWFCELVGHL